MSDSRDATAPSIAAADAGVTVPRRFTDAHRPPFDCVEWEIRDAVIGDPANPAFEQRGVEFPVDLVPERDQHRRPEVLPRQAGLVRARVVGQADDRPRGGHDRRLGP